MSLQVHGFFLLCVALATVAQSLTGFAFGLILLGLVATLQVVPLTEVAVVISILTLGNAMGTLGGPKPQLDRTVFAANAAARLGLVMAQGQLSLSTLWLSAEALPLVLLVSWLVRRYPPRLSLRAVRWLVFVLMALAGVSLIWDSLPGLLAARPA